MLIHTDIYDANGRLRTQDLEIGWSVYCLFCKPFRGQTFVKIGVSSVLMRRLLAISTGCPFEYDVALFAGGMSKPHAYEFETRAHRALKPFSSAKEWYCFDVADDAHKRAFNQTMNWTYQAIFERDLVWKRIYGSQIKAFATELSRKSRGIDASRPKNYSSGHAAKVTGKERTRNEKIEQNMLRQRREDTAHKTMTIPVIRQAMQERMRPDLPVSWPAGADNPVIRN